MVRSFPYKGPFVRFCFLIETIYSVSSVHADKDRLPAFDNRNGYVLVSYLLTVLCPFLHETNPSKHEQKHCIMWICADKTCEERHN